METKKAPLKRGRNRDHWYQGLAKPTSVNNRTIHALRKARTSVALAELKLFSIASFDTQSSQGYPKLFFSMLYVFVNTPISLIAFLPCKSSIFFLHFNTGCFFLYESTEYANNIISIDSTDTTFYVCNNNDYVEYNSEWGNKPIMPPFFCFIATYIKYKD